MGEQKLNNYASLNAEYLKDLFSEIDKMAKTVETNQESFNDQIKELNSLKGMQEYVGTINPISYAEFFDTIKLEINNIRNTIAIRVAALSNFANVNDDIYNMGSLSSRWDYMAAIDNADDSDAKNEVVYLMAMKEISGILSKDWKSKAAEIIQIDKETIEGLQAKHTTSLTNLLLENSKEFKSHRILTKDTIKELGLDEKSTSSSKSNSSSKNNYRTSQATASVAVVTPNITTQEFSPNTSGDILKNIETLSSENTEDNTQNKTTAVNQSNETSTNQKSSEVLSNANGNNSTTKNESDKGSNTNKTTTSNPSIKPSTNKVENSNANTVIQSSQNNIETPRHTGGSYSGSTGYVQSNNSYNTLESLPEDNPDLEIEDVLKDATTSIDITNEGIKDNIVKGNKYTKIPTSTKPITNTSSQGNSNASKVVPLASGISAAAAAGLGSKVYMDRKKNNDNGEDEDIKLENLNESLNLDYNDESDNEKYLDDDFFPTELED